MATTDHVWQKKRALHTGARRLLSTVARVLAVGQGFMVQSMVFAGSAQAETPPLRLKLAQDVAGSSSSDGSQGALAAFLVGLAVFAATTSIVHLRSRQVWQRRHDALRSEISELQARNDRARLLLEAERQIIITWGNSPADPEIEGDWSVVLDTPVARRMLAFGSWLEPAAATRMEGAVERLRSRGEAFTLTTKANNGNHVEIEGRAVGGRAVMRIRDVTGDRLERLRLEADNARIAAEGMAAKVLLDALPQPIWLRGPDERLIWVNRSYALAVDCNGADEVLERQSELLDRAALQRVESHARDRSGQGAPAVKVPTIVAGRRQMLEIITVTTPLGPGSMASDVSLSEQDRAQTELNLRGHQRVMHWLPIAVAMFDRLGALRFHNAAYANLWSLDAAFLSGQPTDGEILDRLRSERRLPEQADYRKWKRELLDAYRRNDPVEHVWHLPDGRTLHVVSMPDNDGGVAYYYEDVTQQYRLESRYNALARVQGETLDALKEGVAVFGSDGRMRLANIAFYQLWHIESEALTSEPHIDAVASATPLVREHEVWRELKLAVTGLHESRRRWTMQHLRSDGSVLDCTAVPLPDGATLITFADVTAAVNAKRMLEERNDALEFANRVKNDFVHNVSWELRSPLQTVTGFVQMLADGTAGPLNDKQRDYAEHISRSSQALLALMNDIFDLASIDTGTLELDMAMVEPRVVVGAAVAGLAGRVSEAGIHLDVNVPMNLGPFRADPLRVRQVLFNLISNAIGFSEPGQTITVSAWRERDDMVFKVSDQGRGIPVEMQGKIFERFESQPGGTRHKGVGLGLSIVQAFVALHGGQVKLESEPGRGTSFLCIFPARSVAMADMAGDARDVTPGRARQVNE